MEFKKLLEKYRNDAGLNKTELANKIPVAPGYYMQVESGAKKPPPIDKCKRIATILGLNEIQTKEFLDAAAKKRAKKETLEWIEQQTQVRLVPVISWVHANQFSAIEDHFPPGVSDEFVPTTTKGENVFALKVKNDCMFNPSHSKSIAEGETVIIDPHSQVKYEDCIVVRDNRSQEATLKQYLKRGKKIVLHPLNPKYPDIELSEQEDRYEIIGKVDGKYRKF